MSAFKSRVMTRGWFWILLVIILVCLNWFNELAAQNLSSLSEKQKAELIRKYGNQIPKPSGGESYQTPPIFDTTINPVLPDSLIESEALARRHDDSTRLARDSVAGDRMQEFEDLRPFGTELFAGPRERTPPDDIAAAADYMLGPGDKLVVALWGQVEKEYVLTIDREGKVFVPKVGTLIAWGKSLEDFEVQLRRELKRIYSDFHLSLSLGKIRSIRVYLTGEVKHPGAYSVSSLTSLFNALYMAGGPNEQGSMRQIRLMRSGKPVAEVDLYKFLLEGDNSSDLRLETGDAIFVPMAGPRVAIRGKVRRPAIYELKDGQTAANLVALAGQAEADAYLDRVMLERVASREQWEVIDLNLNPETPDDITDLPLMDGDRMTVFSVFDAKQNMVAAFGMVKHPGYYERNDSTRISDILNNAKLQEYDVFYERANLFRRHEDWRTEVIAIDLNRVVSGEASEDLLMQDGDSLHVYSIADVQWDRWVYIEGEVRDPGRYRLYDNMTVEDLIFLAGSYTRGANRLRAEVARYDSLGEVALSQVNLINGEARSKILREDDRVYVRQIPKWQLHRTVVIEGELLFPGEYVLAGREETLYDLITRAGGLTELAFPEGTILERKSIGKNLERLQIPNLLVKSSPVIQDSLGNINRTVLFEYDANSMNRIVLNVRELLASRGERANVVLEPGDRVYIPPQPSGISVLGAVGANGTIKYQGDRKVKDYVKRAGGFSPVADKDGLRLIKANGEVYAGKSTLGMPVDMGDVVVVPTKIKRERDWTQTVTTVLTATASVLTTVLLIDKL
ncbi:hypothetical protein GF377_00760 [candidate division GN15 bacterium]|nr:hypothetical protein [candidate division GN15 bacterium]